MILKNQDDEVQFEKQSAQTQETNKKSFPWKPIIIISIVFILLLIPIIVKQKSSLTTKETRNITTADYTYTTSQDLTSHQIAIVPERDINYCTISLTLYNKNDEKLFSDTITKYDLKKYASYTYTFEFGFVNSLSGNYIKFNITGECNK